YEPRRDQHGLVVGEAADDGGKSKQEDAGDEDAFAADQVAEAASEEEEAAEGDEVAVDHPGEIGLGEVQVGLNGGEGDVDDGPVEGVHKLSEADDDEGEPAASRGEEPLG